jgi:hypothetical protein
MEFNIFAYWDFRDIDLRSSQGDFSIPIEGTGIM